MKYDEFNTTTNRSVYNKLSIRYIMRITGRCWYCMKKMSNPLRGLTCDDKPTKHRNRSWKEYRKNQYKENM